MELIVPSQGRQVHERSKRTNCPKARGKERINYSEDGLSAGLSRLRRQRSGANEVVGGEEDDVLKLVNSIRP